MRIETWQDGSFKPSSMALSNQLRYLFANVIPIANDN